MPPAPGRDVRVPAILGAVRARLADLPGPEAALAASTLRRIQPPNWTLEWQLPWWLGAAFGLPPVIRRAIVVSNVLGLAAVRLQDDLVDGELADGDAATASRLAPVLIRRAAAVYEAWFPPEAPFWADLDQDLTAWRRALHSGTAPPGHQRSPEAFVPGALASRAAPLLIGARAVTALAARSDRWPLVERCVRRGAAALALLDDVTDWERDLDAGRWNAFVAAAGAARQSAAQRAANRRIVLAALLAHGAGGRSLRLVAEEASAAADLARQLECLPLAEHLWSVASQARELAARTDLHYDGLADQMTQAFLAGRITAEHAVAGGPT